MKNKVALKQPASGTDLVEKKSKKFCETRQHVNIVQNSFKACHAGQKTLSRHPKYWLNSIKQKI